MPDTVFYLGVTLLTIGILVLIVEAWKHYANTSDLYTQERFDKAFNQIIKRELRLEKQRRRQQMLVSED